MQPCKIEIDIELLKKNISSFTENTEKCEKCEIRSDMNLFKICQSLTV